MAKAKTPRPPRSKQSAEQPSNGNVTVMSDSAAAAAPALAPKSETRFEAKSETKPETKKIAHPIPINLEEEIRRRAYEIFRQRGDAPGSEHDDWLVAEREVLARYQQQSA